MYPLCVCVHIHSDMCVCPCPWRPEEGVESPGARVVDFCELPDMGAGNQTRVLWKCNKCS